MLVRVRSNVGVWRVTLSDSASLPDLLQEIRTTRPALEFEQQLSFDPACKEPIVDDQPLAQQGIRHGAMVHCRVDPSSAAAAGTPTTQSGEGDSSENVSNFRKVIGKDGSIQLVPASEVSDPSQEKGFRKGMMALRDMKMHWTLSDFMAMDAQYEFKIKRQEKAICKQVSLDIPSVGDFQTYIQKFAFQRKRFAFLYGKFVPADDEDGDSAMDDGDAKEAKPLRKCVVEAIYEPPQEIDNEAAEGFVALEDEREEAVEKIASMLGLVKVGWIFGHELRKDYTLSAAEVILAGEHQLEAADGVNETPFVTVTVSPTADGTVTVEAFQVSQQCMAMCAEEALEVGEKPNECVVNETFTAIQEGKASKTVENSFFLTVVPIVQHTSETFVAEFPRLNRDLDTRTPSNDEMKKQLSKSGTEGWTFEDRLADFNLLVFLSSKLDLDSDFPKICSSIVDRSSPLDDGYKIIIKSMAGLDGAY